MNSIKKFNTSWVAFSNIIWWPIINKQTRVTRNTATTTDHIFISTVTILIKHRSGIIKTDISGHFAIVYA